MTVSHVDACWQQYTHIAKSAESAINAALQEDRDADARRVIQQAQADLRDLKRNIVESQRNIRGQATAARQDNAKSGQVIGQFLGSKARGSFAHSRANGRRKIAEAEHQAVRGYDQLKYAIDNLNSQLDRTKADLAPTRPAPRSSAAPPPPPTPAQWAADPYRRHELRYWDGVRWTEHVSDQGRQGTDRPG